MGNEAYILYLRSADAGVAETSTLLHQLGFADDPDACGVTPPERAFVRTDPLHLIEGLLSEGAGLHISLRFALCHPSTIDDVFVEIVRRLMARSFALVHPYDVAIDPSHAIRADIAEERGYWQAAFGAATCRLSCSEACRRFLMQPTPPSRA